jgi:branched-chain amino acid transport system permease protein
MTELLQALIDGLSQGSMYAVLAVGVAIVSAVMSFPNFAHGWLVVWAALVTVVLAGSVPLIVAIVIGAAVAVGFSLVSGQLIMRWGKRSASEILMLKSLAFGLALQAVALLGFGESPRLYAAPDWFGNVMRLGSLRVSMASVATLIVAAVTVTVLFVLLRRTDMGLTMRAVAQDQSTSAMVGIRTARVVNTALALAGLLAGIAAFLWFAKAGSVTPRAGMDISMAGFVALVIGGLRSVGGAVLGGLALGLVEGLMATYLPVGLQGYAGGLTYALLIAILVFRPDGLLQRKMVITR